MKLFDLHCDTATELLKRGRELYENDLCVSVSKAEKFEKYGQVCAVWSDSSLSDSLAWKKFFEVLKNLNGEIYKNSDHASLIYDREGLYQSWESKKATLILSVEDARILEDNLLRIDALYKVGVRIMTLNWSGMSCIGGAYNTNEGLTEFGRSAVDRCFDIGIVPDVSHSSVKGTRECLEIARKRKKPIIASHSDSYSVNPHSRNLRDEDFSDIISLGGIVGISLCKDHLSSTGRATMGDIIKHIEYYLSLGGKDSLCLGCDMDGCDMPSCIENISDLSNLANELSRLNYTNDLIEKIFYGNAFEFIKSNI